MKGWRLWLPLLGIALLLGLFALQLARPKDEFVRSALVGQPLPAFALEAQVPGKHGLANTDFADGRARLLNVFASWCVPCAAEAPQLAALRAGGAEIVAVAIRDKPSDVAAFLDAYGDPFTRIGADPYSQLQIALGSSGVPETFVIDGQGIIRHQHIGDIRARDVPLLLEQLAEAGE
ncbi:redoxin family protein [Croceibacterium sp. TMG7-5b_MA50]|uniref:redoxin family protein n=1 Tax=Croceibacterium sp. TMG7-5b_MA50 TaxID=3121290 RepID=UPI0032217A59